MRSDQPIASQLARALEDAPISVWWDRHIQIGADFSAEIERELEAARVVVVFWSKASHDSQWVRDEAAYARDRKKLIPVQLDGTEPPLGFRQIQTLRLNTSNGTADSRSLVELATAVRRLMERGADSPTPATVQPQVQHGVRRWWLAPIVVAIAALAWFANDIWFSPQTPGGPQPPAPLPSPPPSTQAPRQIPQKSIAVLPFTDMSESQDQEFLADGLADEILNLLVNAPGLLVSARTSSFSFKDKPTTIPEIARALGVAHVLEGSIRRVGDRLRVTAQLLRADTGYHVWSETYDRDLADVFEMQDAIATAVAQALQIKLEGGELSRHKGGTQNLEAYQQFLRASKEVFEGSRASLDVAHARLEGVLELDPNYGLALSLLANVLVLKAENGFIEPNEGYLRTRELSQRALQMSPDMVSPHVNLQVVHKNFDHDWAAWGMEAKRALAIDPTDPEALQMAALLSMTLGRWDEAERQLRIALTRDPQNTYVIWNLGANYYGAGRFREAEEVFRQLLETAPNFVWARGYLARTLLAQDKPEDALVVLQQEADEAWQLILLPRVLDRLGRQADADEALKAQIAQWGDVDAYCVAGTYAGRGDHATALQWLERAYDQHSSGLNEILSEPRYRQEPYRAFLRKMKLADEAELLDAASRQS